VFHEQKEVLDLDFIFFPLTARFSSLQHRQTDRQTEKETRGGLAIETESGREQQSVRLVVGVCMKNGSIVFSLVVVVSLSLIVFVALTTTIPALFHKATQVGSFTCWMLLCGSSSRKMWFQG
jgi:hypothetical protein